MKLVPWPGSAGQAGKFIVYSAIAATAAALLVSCGGGGGSASDPAGAAPQIASLSPDNADAEGAAFVLTVNGSAFAPDSSVRWNGTSLPTTYASGAKLTANVPSANLASAGTATVTVQNPGAGGGTSAAATFTINPPLRGTPSLAQFASFQTPNADFANDSSVQFKTRTQTGNAIWVAVTVPDFGGVHGISVSDSQGNTYTLLDQRDDGQPGTQSVAHFYAANIVGDTGNPDTITVHWSSDNYKGVLIAEIAGVTGAPLVGHSASIQDALSKGTNNVTADAIPVSAEKSPALLIALSMNTSGGASDTGGSGFPGPSAGDGFMPRTMIWEWGAKLATLETSSITSAGDAVARFSSPNTDSYVTVAAAFH